METFILKLTFKENPFSSSCFPSVSISFMTKSPGRKCLLDEFFKYFFNACDCSSTLLVLTNLSTFFNWFIIVESPSLSWTSGREREKKTVIWIIKTLVVSCYNLLVWCFRWHNLQCCSCYQQFLAKFWSKMLFFWSSLHEKVSFWQFQSYFRPN